MVPGTGGGQERGKNRKEGLLLHSVSFQKVKHVPKFDGGGGFITLNIPKTTELYTLNG